MTAGKRSGTEVFNDNILRLNLVCNSLDAFMRRRGSAARSGKEAGQIAAFLVEELPTVLDDQFRIIQRHLRRSGGSPSNETSLNLIEEDHVRLLRLAMQAADRLRPVSKRAQVPVDDDLRGKVSRYTAAQRHYLASIATILKDD
ncbi:MAG: hypothetical protein ABFS30_13905 [Pseudomonadota bacterium]